MKFQQLTLLLASAIMSTVLASPVPAPDTIEVEAVAAAAGLLIHCSPDAERVCLGGEDGKPGLSCNRAGDQARPTRPGQWSICSSCRCESSGGACADRRAC